MKLRSDRGFGSHNLEVRSSNPILPCRFLLLFQTLIVVLHRVDMTSNMFGNVSWVYKVLGETSFFIAKDALFYGETFCLYVWSELITLRLITAIPMNQQTFQINFKHYLRFSKSNIDLQYHPQIWKSTRFASLLWANSWYFFVRFGRRKHDQS